MMYFAKPAAAMGNVRKVLKPGGRLVLVMSRATVDNR